MPTIYKGFKVYLSDSTAAELSLLGNYVLCIPVRTSTLPTSNSTHSTAQAFLSFWGNYITDLSALGNWGVYEDADIYEKYQAVAPMMRNYNGNITGYIKLVASSGFYALGQVQITNGVLNYSLYDNNGTYLGSVGTQYGFPFGTPDQFKTLTVAADAVDSAGLITSSQFQALFVRTEYNSYVSYGTSLTNNAPLQTWLNGIEQYLEETDPYANLPTPGDDPLPGGGAVGIPGFPGLTATSAGVIGLFAPSAGQMQLLADFMWTDFGGTGTTVEEILQEVVEALKRSISNPLDYIIGLNIIPSQGLSIGGAKVVRFGFISSGVSMPQLANQYFTVDCGALSFDTVCGDTFLDYAPYSKFSIYLPYIGFKDVDPNDFVGHTIGVVYHGDCVTGGVTAYITKDGTVMYQYSGCCALNVPLSADNWGETISAAINVATGIVAAAATGGAAGLAQGALKGAASVAANPSLLSPQVSHSGAVSGGAGCMGVQFPFVIREAVNFHSTAGFNKSTGYPAYYYKKLGDVTGFTTVIDAHLSDIPMATQDEIAEIESLLESGVIL